MHHVKRHHLVTGESSAAISRAIVLLSWDDIDEKIEIVVVGDARSDVIFLQSASFGLVRVQPGSMSYLNYENFACFGEKNRCFGADHSDVLIASHDLFDSRQRKHIGFEIFDR